MRPAGITFIIIGTLMFYCAAITANGQGLGQWMTRLGHYSFFLWLPALVCGGLLIVYGEKRSSIK